jgi:CHAD domain-containing protein
MKRKEISEFLYRFYQKRSASFLANIYKASITTDSRDIHRARLDVKKLYALYDLFEILAPESFDQKKCFRVFRPLYLQAGKIREIQVNFLLLDELEHQGDQYPAFQAWLRESERKAIRAFVKRIKKLSEKEIKEIDNLIKDICRERSLLRLRSKSESFFTRKAGIIKRLQEEAPGEKEIHKIRQNLKAMSAIATLLHSIRERKQLDTLISALNRTEIMIGNWHDRIVLINSVEVFLKQVPELAEEEGQTLSQLQEALTEYNHNLVQNFLPEVEKVVETVLI